jgi:hypothetical protein
MSDFFCGQCGKTFYQKSHADAHRKRKTPCAPEKKPGSVRESEPVPHSTHHYTAALQEKVTTPCRE